MNLDERDPLLAAFLAQHDVACPNCDYNLRGLDKPRCPECGVALTVTVTLRSHAAPGARSAIEPPLPSAPFPKLLTIEVNPESASRVRRVEQMTAVGGLLGTVVVFAGVATLAGWCLGVDSLRPAGWSGPTAVLVAHATVLLGWWVRARIKVSSVAWAGLKWQHWVRLASAWAWGVPFACGWW